MVVLGVERIAGLEVTGKGSQGDGQGGSREVEDKGTGSGLNPVGETQAGDSRAEAAVLGRGGLVCGG